MVHVGQDHVGPGTRPCALAVSSRARASSTLTTCRTVEPCFSIMRRVARRPRDCPPRTARRRSSWSPDARSRGMSRQCGEAQRLVEIVGDRIGQGARRRAPARHRTPRRWACRLGRMLTDVGRELHAVHVGQTQRRGDEVDHAALHCCLASAPVSQHRTVTPGSSALSNCSMRRRRTTFEQSTTITRGSSLAIWRVSCASIDPPASPGGPTA